MNEAIAIIPARGGSQRLPRKNLRMFFGKPIIAWSIETAQRSKCFASIVVTTDDDEIAEVAEWCGAKVHRRPYCDGTLGTQEVAARALDQLGSLPPLACVIYATAPLMTAHDLRNGWAQMQRGGTDFAFAVGTDPLQDAGQFYWGRTAAFQSRTPLIGVNTRMLPIGKHRVCDINTWEDFLRAERMHQALTLDRDCEAADQWLAPLELREITT